METPLLIALISVGAVVIFLGILLLIGILRNESVAKIYQMPDRGPAFALEIIKKIGCCTPMKDVCLQKPQQEETDVSPYADLLLVSRGGILLLAVEDKPGTYRAPVGQGHVCRLPDGSERGFIDPASAYAQKLKVLDGILRSNGIMNARCEHGVLLTHEDATLENGDDNVYDFNSLKTYLHDFSQKKRISEKDCRALCQQLTHLSSLYERSLSIQ